MQRRLHTSVFRNENELDDKDDCHGDPANPDKGDESGEDPTGFVDLAPAELAPHVLEKGDVRGRKQNAR